MKHQISYWLIGLGVLLAFNLERSVVAQCDSGGCRAPIQTPSIQGMHNIPPSLAVCRIEVGTGPVKAIGTGMAVSSNGQQTAILTARHVAGRVGLPAAAMFPDGTRLVGWTSVLCHEADVAIIVVEGRAPQLILIAPETPAMGTLVAYGGFDGGRGWQHRMGRLVQQTLTGDWVITGPARGGDSGGPVWTDAGLVGVIWGTDGRETLCTSLPQLINFFESKRYIFPWNAWLEDRKDARQHGQRLPPQPMPHTPLPPSQPSGPNPPVVFPQPSTAIPGEFLQRLVVLESKLAALEVKIGQLEGTVTGLATQSGSAAEKAAGAANLAEEAKRHAEAVGVTLLGQVKNYILGLLPIGWGVPIVVVVFVAAFLIWRDVHNRKKTGDPLEIEKLFQRLAAKTPTPIDDWLVDKLSKALDLVLPRPASGESSPSGKKGKSV